MKEVDQAVLLKHLETVVKQQLEVVETKFYHLDNHQLQRPAANNGWSIIQCLAHLNTYGYYYLPRIEKALSHFSGKPAARFRSGWLGAYFIKKMDPATSTKSYQAAKLHVPSLSLAAPTVMATFLAQQAQLLHYLQLAAKADLNTIKIPISIAKLIHLKLGDVFQFLIVHAERHLQQADRNLRSKDH